MMKIVTILGTRPEITKLSPLLPLLDTEFDHKLIHTGQHYDHNMDQIFFGELNLRKPDYELNVGSGSHAEMTAKMLVEIEKILISEKPDWTIVFADPNTPLAGALAAAKLHLPLVHMEAGCRSFNKKMPEEINRIICDHCADLLLAPDEVARANLLREGLDESKIFVVGSTAPEATKRSIAIAKEKSVIIGEQGLVKDQYILLTCHRAENTNDPLILKGIIDAVNSISERMKVVFPVHPRTKKILEKEKIVLGENVLQLPPQGNLELLSLLDDALLVMTDSGGIQEEAAALDTPAFIIRNDTEWTYLTDAGKNKLISNNGVKILAEINDVLDNPSKIENMKNVRLNLNTQVAEKIVSILKDEKK